MEDYIKFRMVSAQADIGEAEVKISEAENQFSRVQRWHTQMVEQRDEIAKSLAEFSHTVRTATVMPEKGTLFVVLDGKDRDSPERWNKHGMLCLVTDPEFGFAVRFTAEADGMPRHVFREPKPVPEFRAGDVLEYLTVGPVLAYGEVKVGDRFVLTGGDFRNHRGAVLQRAKEMYESSVGKDGFDFCVIDNGSGRIRSITINGIGHTEEWPTIAGTVVSVEPRCAALAHLLPGVQSLDDPGAAQATLESFTLHQMFIPVLPELKAATKRK